MSPERLANIGDFGYTFDKCGGNGFGLNFVKEFVEEFNGEFKIKSEAYKGTKVFFSLLCE